MSDRCSGRIRGNINKLNSLSEYMPLCTSIDMSMGLAYVGLTEMTMTVGISMAGKSLQETRQGVSNLSQKYPRFGAFLVFWVSP